MRSYTIALLLVIAIIAGVENISAKKPPRSAAASNRRGPNSRSSRPSSSSSSKRPPISKRRSDIYDDEDEEDDSGLEDPMDDEEDEYEAEIDSEEDDEDDYRPRPSRPTPSRARKSSSSSPKSSGSRGRGPAPKKSASRKSRSSSSSSSSRYDDEEEDYPPPRRSAGGGGRNPPRRGRGGPPPRRGRPGGRVVPYSRQRQQPSTFTRGLTALRSSMPDPGSVKEAAIKSLSVARETTSGLSSNLFREVKGLTSSELEQVMLKATRPDDAPVKGKHAERLVGVTYQISGRYDIYDAVLRKLWAKMAEKDWRTTIKALYILHRFSADGSPDHAPALKVRSCSCSMTIFSILFYCCVLCV
jgi:hypothetical protein